MGARRTVSPIACGVLAALLPAPAGAWASASVSADNGELRYSESPNPETGEPGNEANNLRIAPVDGEFEVTDSGTTITIGPGCRAEGAVVRCQKNRIVRVSLGGGDDTASVTGFPDGYSARIEGERGNDTLSTDLSADFWGGAGDDLLVGGPKGDAFSADADYNEAGQGNDTIRARGGGKDLIECGPGKDTAEVDAKDVPAPDSDPDGGCEGGVLLRPTLSTGGRVKISRRRRVIRIPINCSKADCFGRVKLVAAAAFGPRTRTLRFRGRSARVRLPKGRRKTFVRVRLSRREHARLRRIAGQGGELSVLATLRDSAGHVQRSGASLDL